MKKYILIAILTLFTLSCGVSSQDENREENTNQLGIQKAPINGQPVSINQNISLVFTAELKPSSVTSNSAYIVNQNNTDIIFDTAIELTNSNKTIVFKPYTYFQPSTTYTIIITTAIEDVLGRNLSENYSYSFTTAADSIDNTALTIRSVKPEVNSTSALVETDIVIEFNKNISSQAQYSAAQYIKVTDQNTSLEVPGKIEVFNSLLKFIPTVSLNYDSNYTVELMSSVTDLYGNSNIPSTQDKWDFRTKQVNGSPTGEGFSSIWSLNTGINSSHLAISGTQIVVARAGGIDFYKIVFVNSYPTLEKLSSFAIGATITSLKMKDSYILVGTNGNGVYLLTYKNSIQISLVHNILQGESIFGVNFSEIGVDKIYAVGPSYGLGIFSFNIITDELLLTNSFNTSIVGTAIDVMDINDTFGQSGHKIYVADYDGGVNVIDINGTPISRTDLNISVKKLVGTALSGSSFAGLDGVVAIGSSGKIQKLNLDGTLSAVKTDFPGGISDVYTYINPELGLINYYSSYLDGLIIAQGESVSEVISTGGSVISSAYIDAATDPISNLTKTNSFILILNENGQLGIYNVQQDSQGPRYEYFSYPGAINAPISISFFDSYFDIDQVTLDNFKVYDLNSSNPSSPIAISMTKNINATLLTVSLQPDVNLTSGHDYNITILPTFSDKFQYIFNSGVVKNLSFTMP